MSSTALVTAFIAVAFAIIIVVISLLARRAWRRRKVPEELPYRKHSTPTPTTSRRAKGSKIFRSKSLIRNEIPEFVIPGTQLRLVQPIITPPTPTIKPTSPRAQTPTESTLSDTHDKDMSPSILPRGQTVSLPLDRSRKISLPPLRQRDTPSSGSELKRRSSSIGIVSTKTATPPERQVQAVVPLASSPPRSSKPLSRNPSSSSIDLLAINVPPSTRSAYSSLEGSRDSSRQSPDESPRLLRLFRQSKHQIKLTGATLEFSLQYQISQRALVLNIMRVRNVLIPVERKHDAKLCLGVHLKPDKFIWEAQTKIVQGTENPIFGEMFTISGFSLSKLHDCALLFRLNDFNVDQTIGEVTYSLRDLQPDVLTSRKCQLQKPIGVAKEKDRSYVGDLLVSMDYDPIDWKLNIRIIRARGLPKMTRAGHTDAFVKINVMQDLSRIFKRKTKVQHHEWNPEFDEGFDFELTRDQMESTSITMKVIHRGKLRDHLIGVVLVGFNVDPAETGYQHWAMMLDKPNLSIEQWHKIYPVLK